MQRKLVRFSSGLTHKDACQTGTLFLAVQFERPIRLLHNLEANGGPDHLATLRSMYNLGVTYNAAGKWAFFVRHLHACDVRTALL
jgi:hypothetical protein